MKEDRSNGRKEIRHSGFLCDIEDMALCPAGSSSKARSTFVLLLDATTTEARSAEAALAVAIPNPEVPPIMTIRCPSKLRLSEGRAGNFICCMTIIVGEA